ncbi:hypothetical protein ACGH7X_34120 [Streptomyces sp. BBFR51]
MDPWIALPTGAYGDALLTAACFTLVGTLASLAMATASPHLSQ